MNDSTSPISIEPIPFRTAEQEPRRPSRLRWLAWITVLLIFVLLSASAWFVFTARQVVVRIEPEPDRVSVEGGIIAPRLGGYYLLRPGQYTFRAFKACYEPLEQVITVGDQNSQTVNLIMEKRVGYVTLRVHHMREPSVGIEEAQIHIDGEEVGLSPLQDVEVKSGRRRVEIYAARYQTFGTDLDIEGCGRSQSFDFGLVPAWAEVSIRSVPEGANVRVDGTGKGRTPLALELLPGTYQLEISADGHKTWRSPLVVDTNQARVLDDIHLQPADGTLVLQTKPPGANVTVGKNYVGRTPLRVNLPPDSVHVVRISKAGYEKVTRKVTLPSAKTKKLTVDLVARKGVIHLSVEPKGAELLVDGQSWGMVPPELRLSALEHQLEIRKEGYQPFQTMITPRPGFPEELRVALRKRIPAEAIAPVVIEGANGYTLKLIRPGSFTMGASRREQGRRSNETLRKVTLEKPFYIGLREVTNKEFREFLGTHNSESFKGHTLNLDDLPVVEVTWEQAALFCNWLSTQESLPPSYVKEGGRVVAAEPLRTGYRLPTEAEWEYCARFNGSGPPLKYPWGDRFPPTPKSGNFADSSTRDMLPNYVEDYDDGFAVTSPPGVFEPNVLGLYDLGGNVAEWCHDQYSIYPYSVDRVYVDPVGPRYGKHRVVKGSSWRDSSISALRSSYRDYDAGKRPDLGFRICRYLTDVDKEE